MKPLTEERVREIFTEMMEANDVADQYAIPQVPYHTHNGLDAPKIPLANITAVDVDFTNGSISYQGEIVLIPNAFDIYTGLALNSNSIT